MSGRGPKRTREGRSGSTDGPPSPSAERKKSGKLALQYVLNDDAASASHQPRPAGMGPPRGQRRPQPSGAGGDSTGAGGAEPEETASELSSEGLASTRQDHPGSGSRGGGAHAALAGSSSRGAEQHPSSSRRMRGSSLPPLAQPHHPVPPPPSSSRQHNPGSSSQHPPGSSSHSRAPVPPALRPEAPSSASSSGGPSRSVAPQGPGWPESSADKAFACSECSKMFRERGNVRGRPVLKTRRP
jgi:hypothetical protein